MMLGLSKYVLGFHREMFGYKTKVLGCFREVFQCPEYMVRCSQGGTSVSREMSWEVLVHLEHMSECYTEMSACYRKHQGVW